ncbi:MAG: family ATPase [Thermoleophilia bacterium]|nr:family ATPase [Thermoleophilia bacterium]
MTRQLEVIKHDAAYLRAGAFETIEGVRAEMGRSLVLTEFEQEVGPATLAVGSLVLEGRFGGGKSIYSTTLAAAIDGDYRRLQGGPDNTTNDIVGFRYWDQGAQKMVFEPGVALTANLLHADELNRNPDKVQAGLLEVMGECQATVAGETYHVKDGFTVVATQNHSEEIGIYKLPGATLDRFAMMMTVNNDIKRRGDILDHYLDTSHETEAVADVLAVVGLRKALKTVQISRDVRAEMMEFNARIAAHPGVAEADSFLDGRVALREADVARYHALSRGKEVQNVIQEDLDFARRLVYPHRIVLTDKAVVKGYTPETAIDQVINKEV